MVEITPPDSVVVLGPTASGKTALAVHLAEAFGGEILSADSRQVYRGLDIGSGKDLAEYGRVGYHLIDIASLPDEYSVFHYQDDFFRAFDSITCRGFLPVVCGGTGLYLDSVIRGYSFNRVEVNPALRAELSSLSLEDLCARLLKRKPVIHNKTDLLDRERVIRAIEIAEADPLPDRTAFSDSLQHADGSQHSDRGPRTIRPLVLGVRFARTELRKRIGERLDARISAGMVEEVTLLHEAGISWERLERLGLEYKYTALFLQEKMRDFSEFRETLYTAICQFAKRQDTWFRGMERKGVRITWVENGSREAALEAVSRYFKRSEGRN